MTDVVEIADTRVRGLILMTTLVPEQDLSTEVKVNLQRKESLERYYSNPNKCLNCLAIINVPENKKVTYIKTKKFCNCSCASTYNNKQHPKRELKHKCANCNDLIYSGKTYCKNCTPLRLWVKKNTDVVVSEAINTTYIKPKLSCSMLSNSKRKGDVSETMVLAEFVKLGKTVAIPFGDNERYDLLLEENGKFLRIQVKTAVLKDNKLFFSTTSSYKHRGRGKKDYKGQADLFAAYSPELNKVYLVPVDDVGVGGCRLRLKQSKLSTARLADDFELSQCFDGI